LDAIHRTITEALQESARTKQSVAEGCADVIAAIAGATVAAIRSGGKIILFGNGGSAADAQHLAAELVGRFRRKRRAIPALALTTNTSIMSALGNDFGFETVFSRQIEALARQGDIVFGISTSGDSANVLEGITAAKKLGAVTVAFTGARGGRLASAADLVFKVPSDSTPRIQEAHITVGHIVCDIVESELTGS